MDSLQDLTQLYTPKDRPMRVGIMMSGTGSNAEKIINEYITQLIHYGNTGEKVSFEPVLLFTDNASSRAFDIHSRYKHAAYPIPYKFNSLDIFLGKYFDGKLTSEARQAYDAEQSEMMSNFGVDVIALAGYNWIISESLWSNFLTINVHPGNLRAKTLQGKIAYSGLGWIPSAKAILAREDLVYTTVHVVNGTLDAGPILAVSQPQNVPLEIGCYDDHDTDRKQLLGDAKSLQEVISFINGHRNYSDAEINKRFPIYGYAKDCQERLKVHGDWVEYPKAITHLGNGNYFRDSENAIYLRKSSDSLPEPVLKKG